MSDSDIISPVVKRILQSKKRGEESSTVVTPAFVEKTDAEFKNRHANFDPAQSLHVDINLKGLCTIHDLYRDKKVFYKSLKSGQGTQSPYYDARVTLRVKIEIDGETKIDQFEVGVLEDSIEIIAGESSPYDLEEYTIPAAVRKVMKIQKTTEVMQIKCTSNAKLIDHIDDEANGVFKREWFEAMRETAVITVQLLHIEQKEYIFKLPAVQRVERVMFLKEISNKFFRNQMFYKAAKMYIRIHDFFKSKDSKGNYIKEDATTEEFQEAIKKLQELEKTNLTNLAVINLKQMQYARCVEFCEKAIALEGEDAYTTVSIKAYFLMGKALIDHTEYTKAIKCLEKLVQLATDNNDDPVREEAQKELNRAKAKTKQYQDKFAAMAKKMFS